MSDIVKNSFFLFEAKRATSHKEHIANVLFSFPAWELGAYSTMSSCLQKICKCDGGIVPSLWALVRFDGRWFGQDTIKLIYLEINNENAIQHHF